MTAKKSNFKRKSKAVKKSICDDCQFHSDIMPIFCEYGCYIGKAKRRCKYYRKSEVVKNG